MSFQRPTTNTSTATVSNSNNPTNTATAGAGDLLDSIEDFTPTTNNNSNTSIVDSEFDSIIGYLEDLLFDQKFQSIQTEFINKHIGEFVSTADTDENSLQSTIIHQEYQKLIEQYINQYINNNHLGINMKFNQFLSILTQRSKQQQQQQSQQQSAGLLDSEIFEWLYSITDYQLFKIMMKERYIELNNNKSNNNSNSSNSNNSTAVTADSSFRPDLNGFGLTVTNLSNKSNKKK